MGEIKVVLKDGTEHINPSENLDSIQALLGHKIAKIIHLGKEGGDAGFKPKRSSLESVATRDLQYTPEALQSMSDDEILSAIKKGKTYEAPVLIEEPVKRKYTKSNQLSARK